MLKILFVDQFAGLGGGQRILHDIVHYFSRHGVSCAVALPGDGPLVDELTAEKIKVYDYPLAQLKAGRKGLKDLFSYLRASSGTREALLGIAAEFQPDLIFCNGPRCTLAAVQAASTLNLPIVCAVHLIFHGIERTLLNWCFHRPDVKAVTFCSALAAEPFKDVGRNKALLVGNWVSPAFQTAPRTPGAKHIFGIEESDIVVGVVGRIARNKGQRLFLESMLPLLDEEPRLHLLFAGKADHEDPLEEEALHATAQASAHRLRIHFLGSVANTVALMDALDVLVVPSLWEEPFGLVAIEGMARGLPVVATRSGALPHLVRDGQTGFLVEKTSSAIEHGVRRLMQNDLGRKQMGEAGRALAREAFAAEPRLNALLNLVKDAVQAPGEVA